MLTFCLPCSRSTLSCFRMMCLFRLKYESLLTEIVSPHSWSCSTSLSSSFLTGIVHLYDLQGRFLTTIEGWAGRYPGWALGGGGGSSRYLYCRYFYINYINYSLLYVHWRKKKKKKTFMGSLLSCTWTFSSLLNNNNKKPSLFSFSESLFLHWWFFQLTFLFIPNKAIIISRTLGELIVLRKILRPDHYGKGTKYIIRFFVK